MSKNRRPGVGVLGVLGGLLALMGLIWTLQGLGVLQSSSPMTGVTLWAVIGPIVAAIGAYLVFRTVRTRR